MDVRVLGNLIHRGINASQSQAPLCIPMRIRLHRRSQQQRCARSEVSIVRCNDNEQDSIIPNIRRHRVRHQAASRANHEGHMPEFAPNVDGKP